MLTLSSILLDGVALDFATLLADITIRVGRPSYFDSFTPSTCQITFTGATRTLTRSVTLSRPLIVKYRVDGGAEKQRFMGRTTDASLDGDQLTIIAVGRLSTLDSYVVGKVAYPAERWSDRVARIFTEAFGGVGYVSIPSSPDLFVNGRAAAPISLAQYLDDLCNMVGAIANDYPITGAILVEMPEFRTGASPLVIDPAEVRYAPRWVKVLPGFNKASIPWDNTAQGGGTGTAVKSDAAAIAQYGERAFTANPSEVRQQTDAQHIADTIVARQAAPRWSTPTATLIHAVDLPNWRIGSAVKLSSLPPSAPFSPWTAIVEGWTDVIQSDGETLTWEMELALSDPLLSGVVVHVAWEDLPPTDLWNTIDPTVTWANADDLAP